MIDKSIASFIVWSVTSEYRRLLLYTWTGNNYSRSPIPKWPDEVEIWSISFVFGQNRMSKNSMYSIDGAVGREI